MIDYHVIKLNPRLQVLYYLTDYDELGKEYATSEKRISLEEAEILLNHRQVEYKELLKVKYEIINVTMDIDEFKNYIK